LLHDCRLEVEEVVNGTCRGIMGRIAAQMGRMGRMGTSQATVMDARGAR
jgi:hypothetical protein